MLLNLAKKRVLVTGSSRGIGLAIAQTFQEEGALVAVSSRSASDLKKLERKFSIVKVADYRKPSDILAMRNHINKRWGGLDVLVANVGSGKSTGDIIPEKKDFENVFKENFDSTVYTIRLFYPLIKKSRGNILLISSIAGREATGAPVDYSVAKTAVISFSKNLSRRVAADGVRVNCLAPGNIFFPGGSWETKIAVNPGAVQKMIKKNVPMGRFGNPGEVSDAAVFLCSERASFITGACLIIDGGQTMSVF